MISHRTRFRENGDLPPWRGSAEKKKPPFFNARASLMTRNNFTVIIMHSTGTISLLIGRRRTVKFRNQCLSGAHHPGVCDVI